MDESQSSSADESQSSSSESDSFSVSPKKAKTPKSKPSDTELEITTAQPELIPTSPSKSELSEPVDTQQTQPTHTNGSLIFVNSKGIGYKELYLDGEDVQQTLIFQLNIQLVNIGLTTIPKRIRTTIYGHDILYFDTLIHEKSGLGTICTKSFTYCTIEGTANAKDSYVFMGAIAVVKSDQFQV